MRLGTSCALAVVVFVGCNSAGLSRKEAGELRDLEQALGALATSPLEDRAIRYQQISQLNIETDRIRQVRTLCVASYRSFDEAASKLSIARENTVQAEAAVAKARERQRLGEQLTKEEEDRLRSMSQTAAQSLSSVNQILDRAEAQVKSCEDQRNELRALITGP
ncbi:MAG: hypothetical protein QNJ97_27295 [Myxococcota bacterium]|nr:hypothetical protein [Myxococcota bacterium]